MAPSERAVHEPRILLVRQPRLKQPGVLAERNPVVPPDVARRRLSVDDNAVPPAAFDPMRPGQEQQDALVHRPVAAHGPPQRLRKHRELGRAISTARASIFGRCGSGKSVRLLPSSDCTPAAMRSRSPTCQQLRLAQMLGQQSRQVLDIPRRLHGSHGQFAVVTGGLRPHRAVAPAGGDRANGSSRPSRGYVAHLDLRRAPH